MVQKELCVQLFPSASQITSVKLLVNFVELFLDIFMVLRLGIIPLCSHAILMRGQVHC